MNLVNGLKHVKKLRKNISSRMQEMLDRINQNGGKIHYLDIKSYNDKRTCNALIDRELINIDPYNRDYYIISDLTDEMLDRYIEIYKNS